MPGKAARERKREKQKNKRLRQDSEDGAPANTGVVVINQEEDVPLEVASIKAPLEVQEDPTPETVDIVDSSLKEEAPCGVDIIGVTSEILKTITAGPATFLNGELRCPKDPDVSAVALESSKLIYCVRCNKFWSYPAQN